MKIKIDEIKVKIKIVEQEKLKAIISLDFDDFVIRGFRIQISKHNNSRGRKLWITPPSYQDSQFRYHPMFFISNKELWSELEEYIWDQYEKQYEEYYRKQYGINDKKGIDNYI